MVARNVHFSKLQAGYLFPEIRRRREAFLSSNPGAQIISLGIGDTTQPLPRSVSEEMQRAAKELATVEGYRGYNDFWGERGLPELLENVSTQIYQGRVSTEEIIVSDGAKCDIGRLQLLFGSTVNVAVQDPTYPVYVDGGVIVGQSESFDSERKQFNGIEYMPCRPENDFFPDLAKVKRTDLIYLCSPNNPTGTAATREQLTRLVEFAKQNHSIIIYDSAYSHYIRDKELPCSIFEIDGAREVALEVGSFSKMAGFTGLRLGWTVVPKELKFDDGSSVQADWYRLMATVFNGASYIVQRGGVAALRAEGLKEIDEIVLYYLANAAMIRETLEQVGVTCYGGNNSPYIWAKLEGLDSWGSFEKILREGHIVCTPGVGFGPSGEGFVRFSALGKRETTEQACQRLREVLK